MTTTLNLNVKFKDATIPQHALDLLGQAASDIIFQYFSTKLLQSEYTRPERTPYSYPEGEFRAKTIALAKEAFDRHRVSAYPGDDVQQVFERVGIFAEKSLAGDFGLTAVRNLHPMVSFT